VNYSFKSVWKHEMQINETMRSEKFYLEKSTLCANLTSTVLGSHMVFFFIDFVIGQLSFKSLIFFLKKS